ncbi:hypothetical protein [Pseudolysinimonas sp.]|jgi:hypothetical protein|uniref:hypothetical protein n=1 Tax=Pseudolysinimonas sp. TaxID=2680009 RepID=UPI003784CA2A
MKVRQLAEGQAAGRIRAVGLLGIGLAAVLLAGCTSDFLSEGGGGGPAPTETIATPEPTVTDAAPDPADELDCVSLLIDRPGNYVVGECGTVTLEGSGIRLTFTSIAELVIRGDGADLVGETVGTVEIQGQGADISAVSIGDVVIRGEENVIVAESTIDTVNVQGNENVVTAGEGIQSPVVDNGLLNEIG